MKQLWFAALCCFFFSAATTPAETAPHWVRVSTPHFLVLSDGSVRNAQETAAQLERMHAVFLQLLPNAQDNAGTRVVVLALRNRRGLEALLPPAYLSHNALELAGLFLPGEDRSYILLRLDSDEEHAFATVFHEYTHYMLRHLHPLPLWLNEGEAEFFQNTDITNSGVHLGQPSVRNILYLRQQTLLPLPTLFAIDRNSPFYREGGRGNIFYAEAWALTHFLFLADFGKPSRLEAYLEAVRQGQPSLAAAQHAFGDLQLLQTELESYIRQGRYQALQMPPVPSSSQPVPVTTPISVAEVDALRADVLVRTGRNGEAEALARAALAGAPGSAEACEALGLLHLREEDLDGARTWYGEAVLRHSSNFLAYYYFGALSLQDGTAAVPVAESNLRESIRLNPHFAPALESLAECDAVQHDHLDEALELSLRAVSTDPANSRILQGASEIRVARREYVSALAGLRAALPLARTADERSAIQARIDQLEAFGNNPPAQTGSGEASAAAAAKP